MVRIDIKDTGPGVVEEERRKIFEPFFTQKKDGTGLGLAIASRILDAHGSHIEVSGREGEGATFSVFLPIAGPEDEDIASLKTDAPEKPSAAA